MPRISSDDLAFAADWLACYDGDPGDAENIASAKRVSDWLLELVERPRREAAVRSAAKRHGVSTKIVRQALAKAATSF